MSVDCRDSLSKLCVAEQDCRDHVVRRKLMSVRNIVIYSWRILQGKGRLRQLKGEAAREGKASEKEKSGRGREKCGLGGLVSNQNVYPPSICCD